MSTSEPAPCHRAGTHHGPSSTGTTPSATAGGPQTSAPARQAAGDGVRHDQHDDGQHQREDPEHRLEGRGHGQQQGRAPGRPPAPVGLGIGEAQSGVHDPGDQHGGHHDAESARRPRPPTSPARGHTSRHPARPASAASRRGRRGGRPRGAVATRPRARVERPGAAGPRRQRRRCPRARSRPPRAAATYAGAGMRRPGAEGVPGLGPQPPEVACGRRRRRQTSAGDMTERLTGTDHREHHDQAQGERQRVGEEAGDEPGVLQRGLVVVDDDRPPDGRRSGRLLRDPASVGDVLGLVGRPRPRCRRRSRDRAGRAATTAPAAGLRSCSSGRRTRPAGAADLSRD